MIANYWSNLNEREQWLAGFGIFCLFAYLFYAFLYSPLSNAVATKSKLLIEKQETLAWMQQVKQQPAEHKKLQSINNTQLLALISSQLNEKPFKEFSYQLQQTGPGDIQLSFDRVPYQPFLSWLWTLSNQYTITMKQFTAERTNQSGLVKLLVVISAK